MTPTESMKAKTRAALADGTIKADGRIVLAPEAYGPHFTPADLGLLVRAHEPDASYTGKAEVVGVDNLEFLGWLCEQVCGDPDVAGGTLSTGRRARALVEEIARAVEADQVEEVPGSVNAEGECVLCGNAIDGLGNNPWPVADGSCCDSCNRERVVPARFELSRRLKTKPPPTPPVPPGVIPPHQFAHVDPLCEVLSPCSFCGTAPRFAYDWRAGLPECPDDVEPTHVTVRCPGCGVTCAEPIQ